MDRMLYIAMSGAKETMLAQATNANNLANANTDGFHREFEQMRAMHVGGQGLDTRAYAMSETPGIDLSAGPINVTGNPLDVTSGKDGWLQVQSSDGSPVLTRSVSLSVRADDGVLVDSQGQPLLDDGGAFIEVPENYTVNFGGDGTVTFVPIDGSLLNTIVGPQLSRVNPNDVDIERSPDGQLRLRQGAIVEQDLNVSVISGAKQGSNVNTIEAMVRMIDLQRKYDLQTKMMTAANDAAQKGNSLLSMN
jgi:flagellar basal-body rod protein FlgF